MAQEGNLVRLLWLTLTGLVSVVQGAEVLRVDLTGVVHPVSVEIVSSAISQAQQEKAALILMRLNTPGGLMDATSQIVEKMAASPVPIVTYVGPSGARAASAGFFMLLAGDVAAMAPGTRTGAASPVLMSGEMDPVMRRKVENDASAWIRSVASRRGRNPAVAEKTVLEAKSFTEQEALSEKLIDLVATNEQELIRKLSDREISRWDGTKQRLALNDFHISEYQPTIRQRIVQSVADPNLAFILLILGALGLYIEFTTPGVIAPGVIGALLFLFGLSALSVLPVNWLGAALLLLAMGLFAAEAFVTSHGVLGVGGAVALVLGALLLVNGPPEVRIGIGTALGAGVPFAAIAIFLATLAVRARREKPATGEAALIGQTGYTRTPLTPEGKVYVHGEYWNASSPAPVPEGARVRVTAVEGLRLRVEPLP